MTTKRTAGLPLICLICGDVARGINYDVMSCMSCKVFFRRNAFKSPVHLQCQANKNCKITQQTRSMCSACRLKKCFELGMNQSLIRNLPQNRSKIKSVRTSESIVCNRQNHSQFTTLDLLRNDRSNLTRDEWTLLSNVIHIYDTMNIPKQIILALNQKLSLPPKLRSKPSTTLDLFRIFYSTVETFLRNSSFFYHISHDACQALIKNNCETSGVFNSIFVMREINALENMAFVASCKSIYEFEAFQYAEYFLSRLEPNGTLVKIMLAILAFSTNSSIVTFDCPLIMNVPNLLSIFNIENTLVTMLWKYLIYNYGFTGAIKRLNSFVKFILDILQITHQTSCTKHEEMMDIIVRETTNSLQIDD